MARKKSNKKWIGRLILLVLAVVGYVVYNSLFSANTGDFGDKTFVYLKKDANYNDLLAALKAEKVVDDFGSFESMAAKMNLENKVHSGKYKFTKGMSNYSMIKKLRSGDQEIIKIVVNKLRKKEDIAAHLSDKLEVDKKDFEKLFNDNNYLKTWGIDSNQIQALIMPYTYDVYWNTPATEVVEKISKAFTRFWNEERLAKARKLKLSPTEVVTIASIVEEETNKADEMGNVASVYLNRIRRGMKLQADPTARFAFGDFTIKRVLNKHIQYNSPWNTYMTEGIPPGPICTVQPNTIDAVLNAPSTDYIFFCAKEDFSGYHNFATNGSEHQANAEKFRKAMDERGIRK